MFSLIYWLRNNAVLQHSGEIQPTDVCKTNDIKSSYRKI